MEVAIKRNNGNVHRDAVEIIVSKNRGAGVSVCNVLLSGVACPGMKTRHHFCDDLCPLVGIMACRTSLIK